MELNKPSTATRQVRNIITPFEKLKRRILREFPKKKFVGDININDAEYELLVEYFMNRYKVLINSGSPLVRDEIFATALVHIGIKYYDGNFWGHVARVLREDNLNVNQRAKIGTTFIHTLKANNKLILDRAENWQNVLMHGFVSDNYAYEMFDFLFKYYTIDLERDLQRNTSEMMSNLVDAIKKSDNTARTYMLVKQTANAVRVNTKGCKIRFRRILKLIDLCFWEQIVPENPTSRMSILFNKWVEDSRFFRTEYSRFHNSINGEKGKKSFSTPYLHCNYINTTFKLILPSQIIKFEYDKELQWRVHYGEQSLAIDTFAYQAVAGNKTEARECCLQPEDIFNEFIIELFCRNERIKLFKVKNDCIRFFDKDGDYLSPDNNLSKGGVYAFTKLSDPPPRSVACTYTDQCNELLRSYFEFEYGDIVRLPDGKPLSIGKKIGEGLLRRKAVAGCHTEKDNMRIDVYSGPPSILLKIVKSRASGTVIEINGIRYRLFDYETTVIDLHDRSGETGYIINLLDYGCKEDGIFTVYVDVPNDRTNRLWQFALINNLSYDFEDSPYLFKSKGTIRFNCDLNVQQCDNNVEKNPDENSYNFPIQAAENFLEFVYKSVTEEIKLFFEIPAFKWKFGSGEWHIEKPTEIWYNDFPSLIYIQYPGDRIRLSLDEQIEDEKNISDHSVVFAKSKTTGIIECDMTRFKSWFGREKVARSIYIDLPKNRIEFIKVITKSVIQKHIFHGDYESGKLMGEFDIIGKANYYVDISIIETKEIIADKLPVINGRIEIDHAVRSGIYRICVYEDDEDDTGFGISNYLFLAEFRHELVNPYDLNGKSISIKYIKKGIHNQFRQYFNCDYLVCNLKRHGSENSNIYQGNLMKKSPTGMVLIYNKVYVDFFDLKNLNYVTLTHFDGYDFLEFLFDNRKKIIVKKEEGGLSRAEKYRRYDCLFPEEYVYAFEFTETVSGYEIPVCSELAKENKNQVKVTNGKYNTSIEKMGLAERTCNTLEIPSSQVQGCIAEEKSEPPAIVNITEKSSDTPERREVDILDTPLTEIGISMLLLNCLKRAKIYTVRNVLERGLKRLSGVQGFDKKMQKELRDAIRALDIDIGGI